MANYEKRSTLTIVHEEEQHTPFWAEGLTVLSAVGLAAASAWIVYSNLAINHNVPMPNAVDAERLSFDSTRAGRLSYYVDRQAGGRPLVLIHSINAAASAYEMSPLFNHFRAQRPVYALDLPGFGFSDRNRRKYSAELYTDAILEFLTTQVAEPADVVALSLGCEFTARAAREQPDAFHSLTFLSPSGLSRKQEKSASQKARSQGISRLVYAMFAFPLWARPFYDLLTTRSSIHYFLQKSFVGAVPTDLVEYDFSTSHRPDAEHAPLYFVSGSLFTPNINRKYYQHLKMPTLIIYDRDGFTSFDLLPDLLARNSQVQANRIVPTLGLAQFERLPETITALEQFWNSLQST